MALQKIGRNDPCLCGSGKKYKKCCLGNTRGDENIRGQQSLLERVNNKYPERDFTLLKAEGKNALKMSEVILEYAGKFLSEDLTREEEKNVITLAIMAWNLSFGEKDEIEEHLETFPKDMAEEIRSETLSLLRELISKKHAEYPHIDRYILDFDLTQTRDGPVLNVVSTFPRKEENKVFDPVLEPLRKSLSKLFNEGILTPVADKKPIKR